jgi:signal peptidase I
MPGKTRHPTRRELVFLGAFLIAVIAFFSTYRLAVVHGRSMEPAFRNGQVVLVRKRTWGAQPLRRGEVVLIAIDGQILIKRIYRLPGEIVDDPLIVDMTIANGADRFFRPSADARHVCRRLVVPENRIAVLGDNIRVSDDSRAFGPVPIESVVGSVVAAPAKEPSAGPPHIRHARMGGRRHYGMTRYRSDLGAFVRSRNLILHSAAAHVAQSGHRQAPVF